MTAKIRQARIERWIKRWKPRLLISEWYVFVEHAARAHSNDKKTEGEDKTQAICVVNPRYKETRIKVYPPFWSESADYQERTMVHEMTHIITDEVDRLLFKAVQAGVIEQSAHADALERLTEHISKITYEAHKR